MMEVCSNGRHVHIISVMPSRLIRIFSSGKLCEIWLGEQSISLIPKSSPALELDIHEHT
jgi:hypothetical protein